MRLLALEAAGLRGLADGSWNLESGGGSTNHLTVVTGPPSSGLTTFLDAVAFTAARLAVTGFKPSYEEALRSGGHAATIRSTWWLDAEERAYGGLVEETTPAEVVFRYGEIGRAEADPCLLGLMSRYDHKPETAKVVLIPARRLTDGGFPAFNDFEADQRLKRLSPAPEKYAGLTQALAKHALGLADRRVFDDVQRLFAALSDSVRLAGVSSVGQLEFALGSGGRVSLLRLGFAERNAFVLAALPVLTGLQRSVVLLDTPEMGLAPGVAARWVDVLREFAPEAQWIVASRDPALVARSGSKIELSRGTP